MQSFYRELSLHRSRIQIWLQRVRQALVTNGGSGAAMAKLTDMELLEKASRLPVTQDLRMAPIQARLHMKERFSENHQQN